MRMNKVIYTKRLSVGITEKMDHLLEDLAITRTRRDKPVGKSDLIREAIRLYLDEQPDARNSRKQIAKSLEGQLAALADQVNTLAEQNEIVSDQLVAQHDLILRLAQALHPVIQLAKARTPKPGG